MAETYVSRPHFEELTLDSGKVHVPARGFRNWALFFANNVRRSGAHLESVWTPHPSTEFWANVSVRR